MDIYQTATQRRSIREFKDKAVPYEILEKCVNAARLAPSAANRQLIEYVIVDDEKLMPSMFDAVASWFGVSRPKEGWPPGRRPKAYIVSLIDLEAEAERGVGRTNALFDVGMAAENIVLVAEEAGLGSCAITGFSPNRLRQVLNVPAKYETALMLALGYPDESPVVEVATDSIERYMDDKGVRHIPKRELKDILHRNRFP
ncbi:MAG: nitroreductase family protein [Dehalococcoidia bacterium]|nr:MAG: nitroreductase family protein [Dehalococcoidia bacterium]